MVVTMTEALRAGFPAARRAVLAALTADASSSLISDVRPVDFVERRL